MSSDKADFACVPSNVEAVLKWTLYKTAFEKVAHDPVDFYIQRHSQILQIVMNSSNKS